MFQPIKVRQKHSKLHHNNKYRYVINYALIK